MKTNVICGLLCAALVGLCATTFAADEAKKDEKGKGKDAAAVERPGPQRGPAAEQGRGSIGAPGERGRGPVENRDEMYKEAMNRRMEVHKQEIAKLEAILKLAEKEKATETAAALKTLIAEKDKEVKDQMEQAEKRRAEMQQRLQERVEQQRQAGRQAAEETQDTATRKPARPRKSD